MKRAIGLLVVAVASLLLLVGIASLSGSTHPAIASPAPRSLAPALACTPVNTPVVVATPAFTPGPGCTSVPPPGVLSAVITQHATTVDAIFTNHSATCSYPIGLASYQDFDGNIEHDTLFDYALAVIPPNSTLTLTVNVPSCDYRAFAFYGSLLTSFAGGVRYNERALDEVTNIVTPTSTPTNTPEPTNTPTATPTITPTPTATCVPRPTPPAGKVIICHATGSSTNPYQEITVSEQAAEKHRTEHTRDIVPAPACGCPAR